MPRSGPDAKLARPRRHSDWAASCCSLLLSDNRSSIVVRGISRGGAMRRVAAVLLLSCVVLLVAGCSGKVSGQISSKSAQKPVPAATVVVGDQKAVTDTSGRFIIDKVSTGAAAVTVQADGFGPYNGILDVQRGDNSLNVVLEDGTVQVLLKENAEVRELVKTATVTVAGDRVSGGQGAPFEATSVPVGEQEIVVASPGHAKVKKTITVAPGMNKATVTLDLTPEETYMRYYAAYRFGRYSDAYSMMHPDVHKHYSFKKYVKQEKGTTTLSIRLFGTKMLSKWRPAWAHKTYRHVAAIDRALRSNDNDGWGAYTDNYTQHWVPVKGRWYILFDWRD